MPKVVIQILSDRGELQSESTVVTDAPIEQAERIMATCRDAALELGIPVHEDLVIEFHYADRDVGAHVDREVRKLWAQFTRAHQPSHILIRPNTEHGQLLSNQLYHTHDVIAALNAFVDAINATGGLVSSESGAMVPAADEQRSDLGDAYITACKALGLTRPRNCPRDHRHHLIVSAEDACPTCGKNDLCNLARDDADNVHCHACGHMYHREAWY
jgi:hypothetical protein